VLRVAAARGAVQAMACLGASSGMGSGMEPGRASGRKQGGEGISAGLNLHTHCFLSSTVRGLRALERPVPLLPRAGAARAPASPAAAPAAT
jgi:hypothetical protein